MALAYREVLALATDMGVMALILTFDCVEVVRAINERSMGVFGHVVREIKQTSTNFESVEFQHEGRRYNVGTHCLAHAAWSAQFVWYGEPPAGIDNSCNLTSERLDVLAHTKISRFCIASLSSDDM